MKIRFAAAGTAIFLCLLSFTFTASAQKPAAPAGRLVKVRYDTPKDPKLAAYKTFIQSNRVLEEIADAVNEEFRMPKDLTLTAVECGKVNAFYQPSLQAVQLCYEYVRYFNNLHINDLKDENGEYDKAELKTALLGTVKFTMYHEVGHALVHLLDLPITGGEEDAVDQLAAVILMSTGEEADVEAVLSASYAKLLRAEQNEEAEANFTPAQIKWRAENPVYADEHSVDLQRFYNTTCLVYGSDTKLYAEIVTSGILPKSRADRCGWEWKRVSRSWVRLLTPFAAQ